MAIDVTCPCTMRFRAREEFAGQRVKCPGCGKPVAVPVPPMDPIVVDEEEPLTDAIPEPSALSSLWAKVASLKGRMSNDISEAFKAPPDRRPLDARQHDELMGVLNSICYRLSWILVLMILAAIGSCTAANVYVQQNDRARSAGYR